MAKKQTRSQRSRGLTQGQFGSIAKANRRKKSKKKSQGWIIGLLFILLLMGLFTWLTLQHTKPVDGELAVHYIDVGQGDAVYISCGDKNMLIDSGEASKGDTVCNYLRNQGVTHLDYVIGTHPHSDHMGGMAAVVKAFDIGEFIIPHLPDEDVPTTKYFLNFLDAVDEKGVKVTEAKRGMKVTFGDAQWEVIAPVYDKNSNTNNYSVGIILRYGSKSFIFTGDAEKDVEKEMLKSSSFGHIDVYKAAHHGSETSSCKEFLDTISPDHIVISCGEGNSYGHPHDSVVKRMKKYTNNIYRTDINGNIIITSDGENIEVKTQK